AVKIDPVLRGHRGGDHHRTGRHFAIHHLAGLAVDDLGGLADKHAHAQDRAFAHDAALDHFRTRADEAVVLDDGGAGLHRLQHAADADAARQVDVLADLRAGTHGCPGVDHRALVDI